MCHSLNICFYTSSRTSAESALSQYTEALSLCWKQFSLYSTGMYIHNEWIVCNSTLDPIKQPSAFSMKAFDWLTLNSRPPKVLRVQRWELLFSLHLLVVPPVNLAQIAVFTLVALKPNRQCNITQHNTNKGVKDEQEQHSCHCENNTRVCYQNMCCVCHSHTLGESENNHWIIPWSELSKYFVVSQFNVKTAVRMTF